MAWVSYQRIIEGCTVSGKYGESFNVTEKYQIRVDSPATSKADILAGVTSDANITWGTSHPEFPALKAMEFDLSPDGRDGMRWTLTVKFYVPPPNKRITVNGLPEDVWERNGGTTSVPAFEDVAGDLITNSAGDPLEGLEREREEISWSLTKFFATQDELDEALVFYAGRLNNATWAGYAAKKWKCYFKGAKRVEISRLDGEEDAGTLGYIESHWEFRLEPLTWKCMPWDVGFMELVGGSGSGGERKTILGSDGKAVKQPVALNADGTAKAPGEPPDVINAGAGVDLYPSGDFEAGFGTPVLLEEGSS